MRGSEIGAPATASIFRRLSSLHAGARASRSAGHYLSGAAVYILLSLQSLYLAAPILWMFSTSLRPLSKSVELPPSFFPTEWEWINYYNVIFSDKIVFPIFFLNSFKIATVITLTQLLTCSMAAYAFAKLRFRGRDTAFFVYLSTMMIPATTTTIPLFVVIKQLNLIDSHFALILPAITSAFGVFLLRQSFMTLPAELMDAARVDGASFFRIYAQVMLPLVGPGLSALGIFTFLGSWNNFFSALLFLRSWNKYTLPIAMVILRGNFGSGNPSEQLAGIMLSILPILIFYLVGQRWVLKGIALTGSKG